MDMFANNDFAFIDKALYLFINSDFFAKVKRTRPSVSLTHGV
jgi:hypothetical protein